MDNQWDDHQLEEVEKLVTDVIGIIAHQILQAEGVKMGILIVGFESLGIAALG